MMLFKPLELPKHLAIAKRDIGLKEIKGPEHARRIVEMLRMVDAWWRNDEAPWCGVAVAAWMQEAGLPYPKAYYRAMAWQNYGNRCGTLLGAVTVLTRNGGGHVGILTGVTNGLTHVRLLGGNQGDAVSEAWFPMQRVIAFREPPDLNLTQFAPFAELGTISKSEA